MPITIDFSPADARLVREQAQAGNVSVEEFSHAAIMKAARNAAYLAKIDRAFRNMEQGKWTEQELIEVEDA